MSEENELHRELAVPNRTILNIRDENTRAYKDTVELLEILYLTQVKDVQQIKEHYDPEEDFEWFTSGKVDTKSFRGKYIAIWKKQIVGSGDTALEVERLAKAYYGEDCRPAIVYVPVEEDSIL